MIQRIQSLFLLGTAIVTGLMFFTPVATIVVPNNFTYEFFTSKVVQISEPAEFIAWNWVSLILNTIVTLLAVVTIFVRQKKTKTVKPTLFLQLRLCIVNLVFQLGLFILMWLQVRQRSQELDAEWFPHISFIFPIVGIIFTWLAIRGIIKDIALLKSFDRIR